MSENLGRAIFEIATTDDEFVKGIKRSEKEARSFVAEVKAAFAGLNSVLSNKLGDSVASMNASFKSLDVTMKDTGQVISKIKFESMEAAQATQKFAQQKLELAAATAELRQRLLEEKAAQEFSIKGVAAEQTRQLTQQKFQLAAATSELKNRLLEEKSAQDQALKAYQVGSLTGLKAEKLQLANATATLKLRLIEEKAAAQEAAAAQQQLKSALSSIAQAVTSATAAFGQFARGTVSAAVTTLNQVVSSSTHAASSLAHLGATAGGAVVSGISSMSGSITRALGGLARLGLHAVTAGARIAFGFGEKSVDAFQGFDNAMQQVQAVTNDFAGKTMDDLINAAIEVGTKYPISTTAAAEGLTELAKAGFNAKEQMDMLDPIVQLQGASNMTLANTTGLVSGAMRAFHIESGKTAQVTDLMAQAANQSAIDLSDLKTTFTYMGPAAYSAGYSIQEMATATAVLGNNMIKGSNAGTGLRAIITSFAAPNKVAAAAFQELGVQTKTADGNMRPFGDVLQDLRGKFANLSEAQQIQMAKSIAGQNHFAKFLALINTSKEDYDEMADAINNSTGAAENMANTMRGGLTGSVDNFKGTIEALQIKLVQGFKPTMLLVVGVLNELVLAMNPVVSSFVKLLPKQKEAENAFKSFKAAMQGKWADSSSLTPLVRTLGLLGKTIYDVKAGVRLFGIALRGGFVVGPQVQGLAATFSRLGEAFRPLTQSVGEFVRVLQLVRATNAADSMNGLRSGAQSAHPIIDLLAKGIQVLASGISRASLFIFKFGDTFGPLISRAFQLYQAFSPLNTIFAVFNGFMTGGVQGGLDAFSQRIGGMGQMLATVGPQILTALAGLGQQILTWLTAQAPMILTGLASWAKGFVEWVAPVIGTLLGQLGELLLQVVNWVIANGPMILSTLGGWAKSFIEWIAPAIPVILGKLGELIGMIFGWVVSQIPAFVDQLGKWGAELWKWVQKEGPTILAELGKIASQLWDWVVQQVPILAGKLADWGKELWQWVVKEGPNVLKELGRLGQQLLDWILEQAPKIANQIMKWAEEFGNWVGKEVVPKLPGLLADIWNTVNTFISDTVGKIGSALLKWVTELAQKWVNDTVGKLPGELAKIWNTISGWIGEAAGKAAAKAGEIGREIINGIAAGIKSLPGVIANALNGLIGSALDGAKGLLGIHSPSTVMRDQVGKQITAGMTEGILANGKQAITAMLDVAKAVGQAGSDAALKQAQNVGNSAKSIADAIGHTVDAFTKLANFKGGSLNASGLNVLIDGLNTMVTTFMQSAGRFQEKGLAAASLYAEGAGKVVGIIKGAVDGLNALSKYKPVAEAVIDQFMRDLSVLVTDFVEQASFFDKEGVAAAGIYADSVGKIVALIANGVKGLMALQEYKITASELIDQFMVDLSVLVTDFVEQASLFNAEAIKAAALYAESVGKMVGIIGSGVKALSDLQGYKAVASEQINLFFQGLNELVKILLESSGLFEEESLKAGATFAESAGKMLAIIKTGVDGLLALQNFKGAPERAINLFVAQMVFVAQLMVQASTQFDQEVLPQVSKFADSISKIFTTLKTALDLFKGLETYKAVYSSTITSFIGSIITTTNGFITAALTIDKDGVAAAVTFGESISKIFTSLKAPLDLFKQLSEMKDGPAKAMDNLLSGISESIVRMAKAQTQAQRLLDLSTSFSDKLVEASEKIAIGANAAALAASSAAGSAADALGGGTGAGLPSGAGFDQAGGGQDISNSLSTTSPTNRTGAPSSRQLASSGGSAGGNGGSGNTVVIENMPLNFPNVTNPLSQAQMKQVKAIVREELEDVSKGVQTKRTFG